MHTLMYAYICQVYKSSTKNKTNDVRLMCNPIVFQPPVFIEVYGKDVAIFPPPLNQLRPNYK